MTTRPDLIVYDNFRYLFERYQFATIGLREYDNSGNWTVVLESPSCGRILVMRDNDDVFVALGPQGAPLKATENEWFDLAVVVEHLSGGVHLMPELTEETDEQLLILSASLLPYMDRACGLFATPMYEEARPALNAIGARREAELRGDR